MGCWCEYYYPVRDTVLRRALRCCQIESQGCFGYEKKTMYLCSCDSDEREGGVGAGMTPTNAFFLQFICSRIKQGEGRGFVIMKR